MTHIRKEGSVMTTVMEPMWTIEEVADFLKIPVKTLYDWRRHGRGPRARRMGKHLRYAPSDVRAWLESLSK
jgi:excisionase family DNA binding protein